MDDGRSVTYIVLSAAVCSAQPRLPLNKLRYFTTGSLLFVPFERQRGIPVTVYFRQRREPGQRHCEHPKNKSPYIPSS